MSQKVFLISGSATPTAYISFVNKRCSFFKVFLILDPDLLSFPMELNTARKSEAKINGEGGIV